MHLPSVLGKLVLQYLQFCGDGNVKIDTYAIIEAVPLKIEKKPNYKQLQNKTKKSNYPTP